VSTDPQKQDQSEDRQTALRAFSKLEEAIRLIEETLAERSSLKVLQLDQMLRALAKGMQLLALKDSELDLPTLVLKHEWYVGQRLYVRGRRLADSACAFTVLDSQEIPEGVVIFGQMRLTNVMPGGIVGLDLELRPKRSKLAWHIRAIDRDVETDFSLSMI
jgi:hypothetical protein